MDEKRYMLNPVVCSYQQADDVLLVFNSETDDIVRLNGTGMLIFKFLGKAKSRGELVKMLMEKFDGAEERLIQQDVDYFLEELRNKDIIGYNFPEAILSKKKVSVCIPSYNAADFIGETIKSVLNSTYPHYEIIVNDDASSDNTREIVEGFDDKRIHWYQNESPFGTPGNWNRAMQKATGEYVGLLNHDDLYGPFWLSFAVKILDDNPHIPCVATAYRVIDKQGDVNRDVARFSDSREYQPKEVFPVMIRLEGMGPVYLARREVLEKVNFMIEKLELLQIMIYFCDWLRNFLFTILLIPVMLRGDYIRET